MFKSFEWLELGEDNRSNGYYNLAKLIWRRHQEKYKERSQAKLLPPFEDLLASAKGSFLDQQNIEKDEFGKMIKKTREKQVGDVYIGDTSKQHKAK